MTPDITMCDRPCPSGHLCYRHTAEPNPYRQAYFAPPYPAIVGGRCDYFSPNMVHELAKAQGQVNEVMRTAIEQEVKSCGDNPESADKHNQ